VRPLPERTHGLVLRVRDMAAALELGPAIGAALAINAGGALGADAGGALGADARGATVAVRLGGSAADVAARRSGIIDVAARHDATIELDADVDHPAVAARIAAERDFAATAAGELVVRFATLPSRLPALAAVIATALATVARGAWQADPARGVLTLACGTEESGDASARLAVLAGLTDAHAAHLVVERWPLALAERIAVWHPLPSALPLMRRMKAALDPLGVLAPGRFIGRI